MKNLRSKIKGFMASKPNYDVSTYEHVKTVGTKFVTIVDLCSCKTSKISLDEFVDFYM